MGQKKRTDQSQDAASAPRDTVLPGETAAKDASTATAGQTAYDRMLHHVSLGHYQKAIDVLRSARREPRVQNAIGVCLMRLGRADDAMRVFRELVLAPGGMGLKQDTPLIYKVNFAASLLLGGQRTGCLDVLAEAGNAAHPSVQRLRAVIREWERTLSFWQRLNWRFGRIEPRNAPVTFHAPPGELELPELEPETQEPTA